MKGTMTMMMIGWRKKMMMMRVNLRVCKATTEWEVSASYLKRLKLMSLKRCKDVNDDKSADDDESHFQHFPFIAAVVNLVWALTAPQNVGFVVYSSRFTSGFWAAKDFNWRRNKHLYNYISVLFPDHFSSLLCIFCLFVARVIMVI